MKYYVSKKTQSDGYHEVHTYNCTQGPDSDNRTYVGDYSSCKPAVREAKKHYQKSDGCYYCSKNCHTR